MSTIADTPRASGAHRANLRAWLAGGGATTALIAGAVIVFLSIASFVAFNGIPFGGGEDGAGTVSIGAAQTPGAPEAAAAAAASASGAVAAVPAAATATAPVPSAAGTLPGAGGPGGPTTVGTDPTIGVPGVPGGPGPGAGSGPGTQIESGVLGGTVGNLEHTAGSLGLDVPLRDLTDPLTGPLDSTVNGTVNAVGGALGQPRLGDNVGRTVNTVTGSLLGPDGAGDRLLGRRP